MRIFLDSTFREVKSGSFEFLVVLKKKSGGGSQSVRGIRVLAYRYQSDVIQEREEQFCDYKLSPGVLIGPLLTILSQIMTFFLFEYTIDTHD